MMVNINVGLLQGKRHLSNFMSVFFKDIMTDNNGKKIVLLLMK